MTGNLSGINWIDGAVLTAEQLIQLDASKVAANGGVLVDATIAGGAISADISNSTVSGQGVAEIATQAASAVSTADQALAQMVPATSSTIGLIKPSAYFTVASDGTLNPVVGASGTALLAASLLNAPSGVAGLDSSGNASELTVLPTGAASASTLATLFGNVGSAVYNSAGATPTSGSTITIPNGCTNFYVRGTATLASLTIELPLAPINNQDLRVIFQVGITACTLTAPSGYTINNPISGQTFGVGDRITTTLDGALWC